MTKEVQLNVKISEESYQAAKQGARAQGMMLRFWIEGAIRSHAQCVAGETLRIVRQIQDEMPALSQEVTGAQLRGAKLPIVREPGPPQRASGLGPPRNQPTAARPKIDISRLLP